MNSTKKSKKASFGQNGKKISTLLEMTKKREKMKSEMKIKKKVGEQRERKGKNGRKKRAKDKDKEENQSNTKREMYKGEEEWRKRELERI